MAEKQYPELPAPDLELTDAQIFDIAADPATCPAPPWWHRDEVAAGDVRKAVLAFARAIIRASRGQAPAPADEVDSIIDSARAAKEGGA